MIFGTNNYPPHFLVLSTQRCGTTLFEAILNAHPYLFCSDEISWLDSLRSGEITPLSRQLPKSAESRAIFQTNDELVKAFKQMCASLNTSSNGRKAGLKLMGFSNALYRDEILGLCECSKLILLVRDSRDLFVSLLRTGIGAARAAPLEMFREAIEKSGREWHLVRYEDLVCYPEQVIGELCKFLEVDYTADMLEPLGARHSRALSTALNLDQLSEPTIKGNRTLREGWRRKLYPEELLLLNAEFEYLKHFNYPVIEAQSRFINTQQELHGPCELIGMSCAESSRTVFERGLPEVVNVESAGAYGVRFFHDTPGEIVLEGLGNLSASAFLDPRILLNTGAGEPEIEDIHRDVRIGDFPAYSSLRLLRRMDQESVFLYTAGGATREFLKLALPKRLRVRAVIDRSSLESFTVCSDKYSVIDLDSALQSERAAIFVTSLAFYPEIRSLLTSRGLTEGSDFFYVVGAPMQVKDAEGSFPNECSVAS